MLDNGREDLNRLLIHLITDALQNLLGRKAGRHRKADMEEGRKEALGWFYCDEEHFDEQEGISFLFACRSLGLCPVRFRKALDRSPGQLLDQFHRLKKRLGREPCRPTKPGTLPE